MTSIEERVRKLLALSGSPNENEAARAAAKAAELIQQHNLDRAKLAATAGETDPIEIETIWTGSSTVVPSHVSVLVPALESLFEIRALVDRPLGRIPVVKAVGRKVSLLAARNALALYMLAIEQGVLQRKRQGLKGRSAIQSYRTGVAAEIQKRAKQAARERAERNQPDSQVWGLVKNEALAVFKRFHQEFPFTYKRSVGGGSDYEARQLGRSDGSNVALGDKASLAGVRALPAGV